MMMPEICKNENVAKTNSSATASFCKNRHSNSSKEKFKIVSFFAVFSYNLNDMSENIDLKLCFTFSVSSKMPPLHQKHNFSRR